MGLLSDEIHADRAVKLVESQADAENLNEDAISRSSDENNILDDDADSEVACSDAEQAGSVIGEKSHAAQPDGDDGAMAEPFEEDLHVSALEATTSAHDDWLHRGPFLFDMDFHTYIRFTVCKPRPKDLQISDADRAEHVFLFDCHYALAA